MQFTKDYLSGQRAIVWSENVFACVEGSTIAGNMGECNKICVEIIFVKPYIVFRGSFVYNYDNYNKVKVKCSSYWDISKSAWRSLATEQLKPAFRRAS